MASTGVKIAYIGGGSRGWARTLMCDLAMEKDVSGIVRLYDIDVSAAVENEKIGNALNKKTDSKWHYIAVPSLKDALSGAQFVIISILPGTFDEMEVDFHLPEKYGIYQSVGDTTGPGGLMRALRTVPMYRDIALAIRQYCPEAWVISYTNPMSICVKTLYSVFPQIKAFGCCHEVFGTQEVLKTVYLDSVGPEQKSVLEKTVKRQDIKVNVSGINHFTWITSASCNGTDLFPAYDKYVRDNYETGIEYTGNGNWLNNSFSCCHRVAFDLFLKNGAIAAAGDRHLAEFCPPEWYLKDPETIKKWKFSQTSVDWRRQDLKNRLEKTKRLLEGTEELKPEASGEEGVKQIKALLGLGDFITNVNLPNAGQVQDLPMSAIVETNALFTKDAIHPVLSGLLPAQVNGLVSLHIGKQEATVRAALDGNLEAAFAAFLCDPLVAVPAENARKLFDEMVYKTRKYIPYYNACLKNP